MLDKTYLIEALQHYSVAVNEIDSIFFAGSLPFPPLLAYQVNFPRFEMVLVGELDMHVGNNIGIDTAYTLKQGNVLYLPAESWNKPSWGKPVVVMSILVGKQSFGMSLLSWDGEKFDSAIKENITRRGPRTGTFIMYALKELTRNIENQQTTRLLITSLFSHIVDLIDNPPQTLSKSQALFEAVRDYLDMNYHERLTRESVAAHFYVSPNYLSQLFQKEGGIKFNEYLNYIRLERSKYLLMNYDLNVKNIAHRCGFTDSNYFCRVFRNKTARSPSEYRIHYHSLNFSEE